MSSGNRAHFFCSHEFEMSDEREVEMSDEREV